MSEDASKAANLDKGKACFNCRRRKVKCDARRPICTPCSRFLRGGLQDCEYTETGPTQSQVLEEKISIVQSRIHEIENPSQSRTTVGLHSPYHSRIVGMDISRAASTPPGAHYSGPSMGNPGHPVSRPPFPFTGRRFAELDSQMEPSGPASAALARNLIISFTNNVSSLGLFFLDPHLFDPLVRGDAIHPTQVASPALLDAVCLWGAHVTQAGPAESQFLAAALRSASTSISHAHTPVAILQALQAHVLLAAFLFRVGRVVEGRYHASLAVSIVMGAGMWRIRSSRAQGAGHSDAGFAAHSVDELPPAVTEIEEGERIDGFWAVVALNATWARAPSMPIAPQSFDYSLVDTPWPVDRGQYQASTAGVLPTSSTSSIIQFLTNHQHAHSANVTLPALRVQAAILYEQALRSNSANEVQLLDAVVERMKVALQHVEYGAPFGLSESSFASDAYLDAILGTLWATACEVSLAALATQPQNRSMHDAIETLLGAMEALKRQGGRVMELPLEALKARYAEILRAIDPRRRGG
ncbi:Zn(2)-C6 fungal-type domain-containing protein [Mycena chlorophos]|uniref:Zn(2)-C6 fungal-type domain-containing protein n=1 Tax=Mycena chlorophos TaxID=658473 RepID=A0A8H6TI49_MYCCL|nr:Zn(2)-C6 fungal-type domain-containing protein [Mycena chlorophos]